MASTSSFVTALFVSAVALGGCSGATTDDSGATDDGALVVGNGAPGTAICPSTDDPYDVSMFLTWVKSLDYSVRDTGSMTPHAWIRHSQALSAPWSELDVKRIESAGASMGKLYVYVTSRGDNAAGLVITNAKPDALDYDGRGGIVFKSAPNVFVFGECPVASDGTFTCPLSVTGQPTPSFPMQQLLCAKSASYAQQTLSLNCRSDVAESSAAVVTGTVDGSGCLGFSTVLDDGTGAQIYLSATTRLR